MLKVDQVQVLALDQVQDQVLHILDVHTLHIRIMVEDQVAVRIFLRLVLHQEVDLDLVEAHVKAILGLDQVLVLVLVLIQVIAIRDQEAMAVLQVF